MLIAALLAFADKFDDPATMLNVLLPSLIAFALGISGAAASVLLASLRDGAGAAHHSFAHNRGELAKAISGIPEIFSSPQRLADEANHERNKLIARHDKNHEQAEAEWNRRILWSSFYRFAIIVSACGFLVGGGYPLVLIAQDSKTLHQHISSGAALVKTGSQAH